MKRFLAREIIEDGGRRWALAVLTIGDDGSLTVEPFSGETHSTSYVEGTIVIGARPAGRCRQLCASPQVWEKSGCP